MSFFVAVFKLCMMVIRSMSGGPLALRFSLIESNKLGCSSILSQYTSVAAMDPFLDAFANTVLWSTWAELILRVQLSRLAPWMSLMWEASSKPHQQRHQCRINSLRQPPVSRQRPYYAIGPNLLALRQYTRSNGFHFGCYRSTYAEWGTTIPWQASLAHRLRTVSLQPWFHSQGFFVPGGRRSLPTDSW